MTLRRSRRGTLLRGHPFEPFSLTGGSHTSVIDIKEVKIKPYELNQYNPCATKNCVNARLVFGYNQS
jgi:hypothetical protein